MQTILNIEDWTDVFSVTEVLFENGGVLEVITGYGREGTCDILGSFPISPNFTINWVGKTNLQVSW